MAKAFLRDPQANPGTGLQIFSRADEIIAGFIPRWKQAKSSPPEQPCQENPQRAIARYRLTLPDTTGAVLQPGGT